MKSFDSPDIMFPHYLKMVWKISFEDEHHEFTEGTATLETRCYIGYRTETNGTIYLTVIAPLIGSPKMDDGTPLPSGATLEVYLKMNESDNYIFCMGNVSAFQCKLWKNVGTIIRCSAPSGYPF